MKVVYTCLAAIAAIFSVNAQIAQNQGQQTTLYVDIAVERQEVIAGPYARYAQKYLGVAAPLTDKILHEVSSAKISDISTLSLSHDIGTIGYAASHMTPAKGFPRLTVDKTSAMAVSLDESARLAAEKIFAIRRSRFDLITGEVGENVFGGGLGSALEELNRLEEDYLSLFLGKLTASAELRQYRVVPTKGKLTYTVCRFSEADGLLSQDDLSGVPVVLELKPADDGSMQTPVTQTKPNPRGVPQLIPAEVQCRIILNGTELTSVPFQISQLGETVYITQ